MNKNSCARCMCMRVCKSVYVFTLSIFAVLCCIIRSLVPVNSRGLTCGGGPVCVEVSRNDRTGLFFIIIIIFYLHVKFKAINLKKFWYKSVVRTYRISTSAVNCARGKRVCVHI